MLLLLFPRSCLPSSATGWARELGGGERARPRPHSRGPSTSGLPRTGHPSPQEGLWGRAEPPHLLPVGPRGWGPAAPCLETPPGQLPGVSALQTSRLGDATVGLVWRGESPVPGVRFRVPPAWPRFSSWRGGGERGQTPPPGQGCNQALTWPSARAMPSMMPLPSRNPAFCRTKWPQVPSPGPRSTSGSWGQSGGGSAGLGHGLAPLPPSPAAPSPCRPGPRRGRCRRCR